MTTSSLVSTEWLAAHLADEDLIILDASMFLAGAGRDATAEYEAEHIPGAVRFDIDIISDLTSGLPHTLQSPEDFAATVGKLGISNDKTLVAYDSVGFFSSPRAWWMFRTMGHPDGKILVLDGGLPKWKAEGRPLESGTVTLPAATYVPHFNGDAVTSLEEMRKIVDAGSRQILDARSNDRFTARQREARAGVRSGHMPGATSTPYTIFIQEDGTFKDADGILKALADAGVDMTRPATTSCGSGVTASVITMALTIAGHPDHTLYDGSWAEWGGLADTPVVTG